MTERHQISDPGGSDGNNLEEMESKRRRQQRRHSELLARMAMNQLADVHRRLNESNPEPDSPMGELWDVMPKPARDFQSAGLPDDAGLDEPVRGDDSECEDSDGVPVS